MLKATLVVPKEKIALKHHFSIQTLPEKTTSTSHGIITVIFCCEVPLIRPFRSELFELLDTDQHSS